MPNKLFNSGRLKYARKKRKLLRYGRKKSKKGAILNKFNKNRSLSGAKLKKTRVDKYERYGVQTVSEFSGLLSTRETTEPVTYSRTQFAVAGHATNIPDLLLYQFTLNMVKLLAVKMGISLSAFSQPVEGFATGDDFYLRWQSTTTSAVTVTALGASGTPAWGDIVNLLLAALTVTVTPQAELIEFYFYPAAGTRLNMYRIDLMSARINIKLKSVLKIQNVTLPADANDDTSDEVTAVPLEGMTVVGKGTGTAMIRPRSMLSTDVGLWADPLSGLITREYALENQVLREIPRPEELISVKKSGKVVMAPGQIQMSTLYNFISGNVNKVYKDMRDAKDDSTHTKAHKYGNYAIHFFEKAIENPNLSPIQLAYQLDTTYSSYMTVTPYYPTTQAVAYNGTIVQ